MINYENRIWGLRAGKNGSAHNIFIEKKFVVLEDAKMGNLAALEATRDSFCKKYRRIHPEDTRTGSAGIAGKYFRFIVEMKIGDLIVYPSVRDKQVYVGELTGEYKYVADSDFPHCRAVKWHYIVPKSEFTTPAIYELGAARTLFEFKRNRDELISRIKSDSAIPFKSRNKSKGKK
tara:strand:+ start:92 stop:619 length:528 start_codon:yes stop_codon:yes gene_type:complete